MRAGAVAWHDVECASYDADLPIWCELAEARGGAVLDMGCGTGRVALELARRGHPVTGLDSDPELVRELQARARRERLDVEPVVGDVRSLSLERRFELAVAPMQVMQLLGGPSGRARALERAREHLSPAGLLAVALADPFAAVPPDDSLPPLPDVREQDGWVLSSQPVSVSEANGGVVITRLRQLVSPTGELTEEMTDVHLDAVSADELEREADAAGFSATGRRQVPATADHVGGSVVLLEARQ
ncbi:MAG TPA: class I SAM-dependent methyltransferase [Thermoleophilaceae bacterium]|nr:class I SAM-dependent methyltransferase [Thermoleophilaceae bacterium]